MKIPPTPLYQKNPWNFIFLNHKTEASKHFLNFIRPKIMANNNLSMKEGSWLVSFCSYAIDPTRMLQIAFLVSFESSFDEEGCIGLVSSWRLDLRCRSS
jgi:hypothetical protein